MEQMSATELVKILSEILANPEPKRAGQEQGQRQRYQLSLATGKPVIAVDSHAANYQCRLYVSGETGDTIRALAQASRRSVSSVVRSLVEYGLEHVKVREGACVDLYFE